jgi:uncharacterized protein YigA (DUF484 family)
MTGVRKKRVSQAPGKTSEATPSAADIKAFLSANPDYIAEHPEMLDSLVPDHRALGGGVVDLQGVLIDRLQSENKRLHGSHDDLLANGRAKLASQSRIHGSVLSLLDARSFRELMDVITTDLAIKLDADVVILGVENENRIAERSVSSVRLLAPGTVDRLMGPDQDLVLNADCKGRKMLYGAASGLVASEALLRLHASPDAPTGILALGARHGGRFNPDQGTELLGFLAQVLELCIHTWLGLPRS